MKGSLGCQIVWNRSTRRAEARGGARDGRPKWLRILTITGGSSMAPIIFKAPPQLGQCSTSTSKTRLSSRAELMRAGAGGAGAGTILLRNFAFGASTPWNRIRWRRGRGTRAARRYMNSSGSDLELLQAIHDADFRRVGIRAGGEAGVPTPSIRRRAVAAERERVGEALADVRRRGAGAALDACQRDFGRRLRHRQVAR